MESKDTGLSEIAIYECYNPMDKAGELYPAHTTDDQRAISLVAHLKSLGLKCSGLSLKFSNSINWNKHSWWWGLRILPPLTDSPGAAQMIEFKEHFKLKHEHRGHNLKRFGI